LSRLRTHDQEAATRAVEADEERRSADAARLYATALQIIGEGLALQVRLQNRRLRN
jgi:hypothetical protein